jgi:predicted transcriptional regulator
MTYVIFKYFFTLCSSKGELYLILPCEVAVKSVIPAIKALMAKQLMEEHGFNQEKVAEILGVSQSAVSKYSRNMRGHSVNIDELKEIRPLMNEMMTMLLGDAYRSNRLLKLFCEACVAVRKTSVMCAFCEKTDPKTGIGDCRFCLDPTSESSGGFI